MIFQKGTDVWPFKSSGEDHAQTYLQLPLWQWRAGIFYLLVLSSWKENIAENPIVVMGL